MSGVGLTMWGAGFISVRRVLRLEFSVRLKVGNVRIRISNRIFSHVREQECRPKLCTECE